MDIVQLVAGAWYRLTVREKNSGRELQYTAQYTGEEYNGYDNRPGRGGRQVSGPEFRQRNDIVLVALPGVVIEPLAPPPAAGSDESAGH